MSLYFIKQKSEFLIDQTGTALLLLLMWKRLYTTLFGRVTFIYVLSEV